MLNRLSIKDRRFLYVEHSFCTIPWGEFGLTVQTYLL